ncbi:MAG: ribbon-helix-helix domain-containing protein [Candidatus Njordarchaeota archaeon]
MKVISIRLPDWMLDLIDQLCDKGIFISRSEFIRYAIRFALKRYEKELYEMRSSEARLKRIAWKIEEA